MIKSMQESSHSYQLLLSDTLLLASDFTLVVTIFENLMGEHKTHQNTQHDLALLEDAFGIALFGANLRLIDSAGNELRQAILPRKDSRT